MADIKTSLSFSVSYTLWIATVSSTVPRFGEMPAGLCDILYFKFSQLIAQLRKLLSVKLLYICG